MPSPALLPMLQQEWTSLYRTTLPALAKEHHPAQSHWPVVLDHCFARIILDNAVGVDKPWTEVVSAPASKNMTEEQLQAAIGLGKDIAGGKCNLVDLDGRSLAMRCKQSKKARKRNVEAVSLEEKGPETARKKSRISEMADVWVKFSGSQAERAANKPLVDGSELEETEETLSFACEQVISPVSSSVSQPARGSKQDVERQFRIDTSEETLTQMRATIAADSSLTPFRKRVLTLLTQVPRGRYTTYKAMSDAVRRTVLNVSVSPAPPKSLLTLAKRALADGSVGKTAHDALVPKSCARAIGSAMRNNPFAPTVPCHRVLAADGKIGGFGGDWGDTGRFAKEKIRLLREEGVRFDGRGRVIGGPFVGFV